MHNLSTDGAYCGISRGELDWSAFDPDQLASELRLRQSTSNWPAHVNRCGPCEDCRELVDEAAADEAVLAERRCDDTIAGTSPPPLVQLVRHAERFGPELVVGTARGKLAPGDLAVLELEIAQAGRTTGKPIATRQRRTTVQLRDQVAALRERGLVPIAIADALNISDRRCREILNGLGNRQNGARNPSVHAGESAAKGSRHVPGRARRETALREGAPAA